METLLSILVLIFILLMFAIVIAARFKVLSFYISLRVSKVRFSLFELLKLSKQNYDLNQLIKALIINTNAALKLNQDILISDWKEGRNVGDILTYYLFAINNNLKATYYNFKQADLENRLNVDELISCENELKKMEFVKSILEQIKYIAL
ncbi:MAG: hypothetical protein WBQ32_07725 [Ignavibacteriaceae bacterium]